MRLHELAFACRIYGALTGYDRSLAALRKHAGNEIDPHNPDHQGAVFNWLNDWGCRQFSTAHHASIAAPSLEDWAESWMSKLPAADVELENLTDEQVKVLGVAYGDLRGRLAGVRSRRSGTSEVTYGPTGAAKTMFALRPRVCPPWDAFTLSKLGFSHSSVSYSDYLRRVLSDLQGVAQQAGVEVVDVAPLVGRPASTPPKLIDEYYWVTITRGFVPPTRDELAAWLKWAEMQT